MIFNKKYFLLFVLLLIIEVVIATQLAHMTFVRGFLGDVLVVLLMYYFGMAFWKFNPKKLIIIVLIFSWMIEFLQYFHFGERLGFGNQKVIMTILGNSFSGLDLVCYTVGAVFLYCTEIIGYKKNASVTN